MGFLDAQFVPALDGVAYGLLLFVVAAGLSLAFGTAGVLNLSHGTLYALGAYTGAECGDGTWGGFLLGLAAGTAVACLAGVLLSAATAPLSRRGHLAQALLTFGLALAGGNLLVEYFGEDEMPVPVPGVLDSTVTLLGHRYPAYRLCFIGMALLLAAAGTWVLTRTRAGAAVRAAADDPQMLAATGISPRAVHTGVLAASGALAGAAGALGAPIIGPGPDTADTVLMLSLVIVVLGGLRSLWATLAAALLVGEVQTLGVSLMPDWAPYLLFAAMAAVLVLRSGLTAEPEATAHQDGAPSRPARALAAVRAQVATGTGELTARLTGPLASRLPARLRGPAGSAAPFLLLLAVLAALPSVLDAYSLSLVGYALALGLLAVSVTVVTGYAGLPTLGQAAPFAVGGYATALLAEEGWTTGPLLVLLAALAAALFSLVTGPAIIRARGTTVLMITLAVGELTVTAIDRMGWLTGGTDGLVGFPALRWLPGTPELLDERQLYGYALTVAAVALALTLLVLHSPAGKLLTGSRAAESRLRASGHPVGRYLLVAHLGAGALAGVGGSLMVTVQSYISPADVGFETAALALLAAVIGGTRSVLGALLGAGLIVFTRDWLAGAWPGHAPLLLGALFVAAVYLLPRGLAGLLPRPEPGRPPAVAKTAAPQPVERSAT
ncbi:putative branched-chain amino acid ABC transporter permease protein [Streptomyces albus]|uniref:Putative branched-chain amino acid ABC transporter permease protein n=1 Tax=Streptomyces albus (strain ATCC 21838 / DSM 41398 / FERM P-419 / JCM 4703 / NBRC 107858) TaxID=1081613 RepID=A0A0B5F042_STRA4|nr:putative branched-chain amino acid ABC transporter permease protein [Streptomyces albus]AOU78004.1 putative branched-chain amino acid ABC transporter permease protein [Streptomyces albus]AYN33759.1 branched-chain amino acid ABC transporter permease [Streptomyces albus]